MMTRTLGLDLGTSATKAVLIDSDGTVLARSRAAHPDARAIGSGRADPQAWIASLATACADLGEGIGEIDAIGLSVHCPTALVYDAEGTPLAPGVTWDHPHLPALAERVSALRTPHEAIGAGNHPSPATTMIAAALLLEELEPDAWMRADEFGLVGSWLSTWLTGTSALDPTQASYTGAYSVNGSGGWMTNLLNRAGIRSDRLPEVRDSLTRIGTVLPRAAERLGLPAGVPVILGSADTPAASFALGAAPQGRPLLIMGTTHVVSNCIDHPDDRALALQRADVRRGQWLINGVTNGGDALAAGARLIGLSGVAALIDAAATLGPAELEGAPTFIPHVLPERGPLWLRSAVTALIDHHPGSPDALAAWGVLEGVLFADRMVVESCLSRHQRDLFLSGAFGDDTHMPQLIADLLDRRVHIVDESSLSGVGAAAMAAEVLTGNRIVPPTSTEIVPRESWRKAIDLRWQRYLPRWEHTVGRARLDPFD